jgi:hypothetical protein
MNLPQAIFIDTCILDAEHYNFASTQLDALVTAAKSKGLKLLLPAPTKLEIMQHVRIMSEEAVAALKCARKEHPFLHRMKSLPDRQTMSRAAADLQREVLREYEDFCKSFSVENLDYSGVDLKEVMDWYIQNKPPFGSKGKRKEFPDAFSFAALLDYAKRSRETLAIVSADNDFRSACGPFPNIHYFQSLQSLTAALLAEDIHLQAASALVVEFKTQIVDAIVKRFPNLWFYHADDKKGHGGVMNVCVEKVDLTDSMIIGLGSQEFTAAFSATVDYSAYVEYDDPDAPFIECGDDDYRESHRRKGLVTDNAAISGSVRIKTNEGWTEASEISAINIEEDNIEVGTPAPREYEDDGEDTPY